MKAGYGQWKSIIEAEAMGIHDTIRICEKWNKRRKKVEETVTNEIEENIIVLWTHETYILNLYINKI